MTLALTPRMLETAYEYLRSTPPFRGWKLPPADDVEFRVIRTHKFHAQCWPPSSVKRIDFSMWGVGHSDTLIRIMAHEMVHLKIWLDGGKREKDDHGPNFRRHARIVSRHHGFDPKEF